MVQELTNAMRINANAYLDNFILDKTPHFYLLKRAERSDICNSSIIIPHSMKLYISRAAGLKSCQPNHQESVPLSPIFMQVFRISRLAFLTPET
jgi:hypothetical protein